MYCCISNSERFLLRLISPINWQSGMLLQNLTTKDSVDVAIRDTKDMVRGIFGGGNI